MSLPNTNSDLGRASCVSLPPDRTTSVKSISNAQTPMNYVDMTPYKTPRKMMKKVNTDGEESELSTARGIKTRNYQKTSGHKTRGEQSTQP